MLPAFSTTRLHIARLIPEDAAAVAVITDTPDITRWISFMQDGFPEGSALAMIMRQDESREFLQGVRTSDGRLIGVVGHVVQSETDVEIGYWFALAEQGKGYAREAVMGVLGQL